jgi:hypothetical protein
VVVVLLNVVYPSDTQYTHNSDEKDDGSSQAQQSVETLLGTKYTQETAVCYVPKIHNLKYADHIGFSVDSKNFNDMAVTELKTKRPVFLLDKSINLFEAPSLSFHAGKSRKDPTIFYITNNHYFVLAPVKTYFDQCNQKAPDDVAVHVRNTFFSSSYEFYVHGVGYSWKRTGGSGSLKLVLISDPHRVIAGLKVPLLSFGRHIGKIRILSHCAPLQEVFAATCCLALKCIEERDITQMFECMNLLGWC